MGKPTFSIETPNGKIVATDCEFIEASNPWSEYLIERPGKKTIRVRFRSIVTRIFVADEKTPSGEPILNVQNTNVVKAEELDDQPPQVTR